MAQMQGFGARQFKKIPIQDGAKSGGETGNLLGKIAGGIIGAIAGGPAGALTGAGIGGSIGESAGSTYGSMSDAGKTSTVITADPEVGKVESGQSPMERRLAAVSSSQDLETLRQGALAIPQLTPEERQQYAKPILTAYYMQTQMMGQEQGVKTPGVPVYGR